MLKQTADSKLGNIVRLYGHLSKVRKSQVWQLLTLAIVGALAEVATLGLVFPFLALMTDPAGIASHEKFQLVFSGLVGTDPALIMLYATILFSGFVITSGLIRLALVWYSNRYAFRIAHDLSVEVYNRTIHQPFLYHASTNSSYLISAMTKVDGVIYQVLVPLTQMVTAVVISAFLVAALILISPLAAMLAAIGLVATYLGVTIFVRGRLEDDGVVTAWAMTERLKILQEGLGGIRDVLINQSERVFLEKYTCVDDQLRRAQSVSYFIAQAPRYLIETGGIILITVITFSLSFNSGGVGPVLPVLGALAMGSLRLLPLLQAIYKGWTDISYSRNQVEDVLKILDLPLDKRSGTSGDTFPMKFEKGISLQGVTFSYHDEGPKVLDDISLSVKKGSRLGLIGKTGSGKSTVVDLVMGLIHPSTGRIKIDGTALTAENVRAWQSHIAHVPQTIYLADSTIAENIAFGIPEQQISKNRVKEVARQAELDEFVSRLRDGYDTFVGERGVRLSGGQRQRIGIARALYRRASVLVFDEATSALDNETEAAVMHTIQSLNRDLTIFIIAHRLSTVASCDAVIRLDAGRIISQGPPEIVCNGLASTPQVYTAL